MVLNCGIHELWTQGIELALCKYADEGQCGVGSVMEVNRFFDMTVMIKWVINVKVVNNVSTYASCIGLSGIYGKKYLWWVIIISNDEIWYMMGDFNVHINEKSNGYSNGYVTILALV